MKFKETLKISWLPVFVASLCCVAPIVVLLAGLGTVTVASTLADTLYGDYKWVFRLAGLAALGIAILLYLRRQKGICTIDDAKRRKNEVFNIVVVALVAGIVGYIIFLYVVVHYAGVFLGLWA
ncbi:MAG: hypothetical protein UY63_C0014G0005 [Parcubacteria group bacterium GW2011_GWA2_51_10]|nr:MAG: hypothetical protein UY63_C0014G0005 [Parcubacteria group bacterium GW2011_GWA2_51_10]